jgi:hypothetical protein
MTGANTAEIRSASRCDFAHAQARRHIAPAQPGHQAQRVQDPRSRRIGQQREHRRGTLDLRHPGQLRPHRRHLARMNTPDDARIRHD